jgi:hypothetical protein
MRCCEELLYIQLISHIETKKLVFNNFCWFNKKRLEIVKKKKGVEGPMRGKVESKIVRNLAMKSKVESPVNDSNGLLDELWAKIVGASDWSDWIC